MICKEGYLPINLRIVPYKKRLVLHRRPTRGAKEGLPDCSEDNGILWTNHIVTIENYQDLSKEYDDRMANSVRGLIYEDIIFLDDIELSVGLYNIVNSRVRKPPYETYSLLLDGGIISHNHPLAYFGLFFEDPLKPTYEEALAYCLQNDLC